MASISNNNSTPPSISTPEISSYLSKIAHDKVANVALGCFESIAHWFLTTFSCFYPAYNRFYNTLLVEAQEAGQGALNAQNQIIFPSENSQTLTSRTTPATGNCSTPVEQPAPFEAGADNGHIEAARAGHTPPPTSNDSAAVAQSSPFEVGPDVDSLDLTSKKLTEIPESIRQCTNLKILILNNNQLSTLPDWLSELPLTRLEVEHNPMTTIPPCVFLMLQLKYLSFHGAGDVGGQGMTINQKVFKDAKENLQKLEKLFLGYCGLNNSLAIELCCQKWLPQCLVDLTGNS